MRYPSTPHPHALVALALEPLTEAELQGDSPSGRSSLHLRDQPLFTSGPGMEGLRWIYLLSVAPVPKELTARLGSINLASRF